MGRPKRELAELIDQIKEVATRYYDLTGKSLGVTGEIAELAAAELLGLTLCGPRQPGFDAWDADKQRVQIKGRAVAADDRYRGRCSSIKYGDQFDFCLLVLIDKATFEPLEIHRASEHTIEQFLSKPGSKARNERNSMGVSQFRSIGEQVWPS